MAGQKEFAQQLLKKAGITINGKKPWDIQVHDDRFYSRVIAGGTLALGESYMDGWWDCEQLDEFFHKVIKADLKKEIQPNIFLMFLHFQSLLFNLQSLKGSKKVAEEHYDLSPDFYMSFLDPYNQYTCGYFKDTDNLDKAQEKKLDLIAKKLKVKPGDKLLDIGSGWGGLAKFMAEKYNASVTGITISKEQEKWSKQFTKGLDVRILNKDYRDMKTEGSFDKVTVVGMIEHVGHKNYRKLMEVVDSNLKEDGLFLLHTIGSNTSATIGDPWITKYIFPNSMAPSIRQLASAFEGIFVMEDWHNFGAYYDKTLLAWFEKFDKSWSEFKDRYGERFYRMWKYYLLSFAGAFRARELQLWQIVLSKKGVEGGYGRVS